MIFFHLLKIKQLRKQKAEKQVLQQKNNSLNNNNN